MDDSANLLSTTRTLDTCDGTKTKEPYDKGVKESDPELYTRWLQSGVFTPIFKTHSTKDMNMEKRFWMFPDHFDAMREAIRLRYDLSPYIYTAARQAYDTGVSITRPLYYYWPEEDKAYESKEEFMFGDDILATTVCSPVIRRPALQSAQCGSHAEQTGMMSLQVQCTKAAASIRSSIHSMRIHIMSRPVQSFRWHIRRMALSDFC